MRFRCSEHSPLCVCMFARILKWARAHTLAVHRPIFIFRCGCCCGFFVCFANVRIPAVREWAHTHTHTHTLRCIQFVDLARAKQLPWWALVPLFAGIWLDLIIFMLIFILKLCICFVGSVIFVWFSLFYCFDCIVAHSSSTENAIDLCSVVFNLWTGFRHLIHFIMDFFFVCIFCASEKKIVMIRFKNDRIWYSSLTSTFAWNQHILYADTHKYSTHTKHNFKQDALHSFTTWKFIEFTCA